MRAARALICLVALVLALVLLSTVLLLPSGTDTGRMLAGRDTAGAFAQNIRNRIADGVQDIAKVEKNYWIAPEDTAPEPDPECFGATGEPSELEWLLEEAWQVLEGQETLFSPEVEILPGSQVEYYLDETILTITWKEKVENMAVTYSEVKIMDPSQFRRYLSGGEFGSGKLLLTTEMSQSVHAVVAYSADYYGYRPDGTVIVDGQAKRPGLALPDSCYVDKDGNLFMTHNQWFSSLEQTQDFVDENNVNFSLCFGPALVEDGKRCQLGSYPIGEGDQKYARAAIAQLDKLHYLYVACNLEGSCWDVPTINRFADLLLETGCRQAYNLDGGQTATVVVNGEVFNMVNYGSQRRISDIIYFATAKPREE